jgi:phenylacetate-CoA ligase
VDQLAEARQVERLDRESIEDFQLQRLRQLLRALASNPFYRQKLAGAAQIDSMAALARLPFTTKTELCGNQLEHPPYGSNLTFAHDQYIRLHQTSGTSGQPMRWLDTQQSWDWLLECWQLIYDAADINLADRFLFPFSFGPFIGFWAAIEGAQTRGCFTLAGGGLSSHTRLEMIADHRITCICCTPTYALRLAQTAAETGFNLARSTVKKLILAGEPGGSITAVRSRIEAAWGARVFDHSGMTEIGSLSIECTHLHCQPHILETEFIAEVVSVDGSDPVPNGQTGELIITNLGRIGSPVIRYRTGDLVNKVGGQCPCGRNTERLDGGILGRIDDMIFIKGNNLYPSQIESIIREHQQVSEFQLVLSNRQGLTQLDLEIEIHPQASTSADSIAQTIAAKIRDRHHFQSKVHIRPYGQLPRYEMKAKRLLDRRQEGTPS